MKSVIIKVLQHEEIVRKPPVLIDVGASGGLPKQWRLIAPFSICVAFDADTRDFCITESCVEGYKKLYSINRLLAAKKADEVNFYLTHSPHCSSSLLPDLPSLRSWAFCQLFDVQKVVRMPAVDLKSALLAIGVHYVDWYKSDSQGTDLRIFSALSTEMITKAIIAEFEPGIIDAYIGEDKLHQLMAYMDQMPFWVTSMQIEGSQRIQQDDLASLNFFQRKKIGSFLKMAPGWCEISYINNFGKEEMGLREYLLGWAFSSIKKEHGFALHLAKIGQSRFHSHLFGEMINASRKSLSKGYYRLGLKGIKRIASKLIGVLK
ncbi:MAG: hypothetical protein AB9888_16215 [Bacteroidales bacterium]